MLYNTFYIIRYYTVQSAKIPIIHTHDWDGLWTFIFIFILN